MKRFILFLPEFFVFGLSFAKFRFLTKSPWALDPEKIWDLVNKPSRLVRWLEEKYPPELFIKLLMRFCYRNTLMYKDHAYGIKKHYDLSNQFYELFLDETYRFYSCADFSKKGESLEEAQENKADYLLMLISPKPGEKILDLGCGWGGMLKKIYEATGDRENLVGYTLSQEQKGYIEKECGFRVELRDFITTDYEKNCFDKIFSIGSLEHVREKELLFFAQKLRKALKPSGKIVHHFFCQLGAWPSPISLGGFDIFPGSELSSLKTHLEVFEVAGFEVSHHSIHDYRPTLEAWSQRLVKNKNRAIELVGVENYNKYLYFFAGIWRLFNERRLLIMRVVLEPKH